MSGIHLAVNDAVNFHHQVSQRGERLVLIVIELVHFAIFSNGVANVDTLDVQRLVVSLFLYELIDFVEVVDADEWVK